MSANPIALAENIAKEVALLGGTAYFVGGCVRDKLRGEESKDIDIEIHGIYPAQIEKILDGFGERITIGESFGIYSIKGCSLDVAMPRSEASRGAGHRDFDVSVDPFIGTYKAALRRDFTVNALMQNVLTGEIIDHFGGADDIRRGVIRHVNPTTFVEDPLRVLRAAQFAARFGYSVADETVELCKGMDLSALPKERVFSELEKALLKAERPSVFFEALRKMAQLSTWFPELEQTIGIGQNPEFHAEGDVWNHTMMVIDVAVCFRKKVKNPLGFMLAAITHDFGKAVCTEIINGRIRSINHEKLGLPLIEKFLWRLTSEKSLIEYVLNLAELHMKPNMLAAQNASVKATNRMFDQSHDPDALIYIAAADRLGKIAPNDKNDYNVFLCERLEVYCEYMTRPYVTGRDLIEAGIEPSEHFSEYLDYAHRLRLAGVDKASALKQTLVLARKTERGDKQKKGT